MATEADDADRRLIDRLDLIHQMYDVLRLVDPVNKLVLLNRQNEAAGTEPRCYDYWQRGVFCHNCVSLRAFLTGKPQYKLEYSPRRICQVTAVPTELQGRKVVAELIKDVTNSYTVQSEGGGDAISGLIDSMNFTLMQDPLTGVCNRRFLNERLYMDVVDAAIRGMQFSVAMGDIDRFKAVNDRHGHQMGDAVLHNVAQAMRHALRKGDWVARYGGDEFLVCLYGVGAQGAASAVGRLRQAVGSTVTKFEGVSCRVTMSFGIAEVNCPGARTADDLIAQADRSLYNAKLASRRISEPQ